MSNLNCNYCESKTKKNGFQTNGKQRYKCLSSSCRKSMQGSYVYLAKTKEVWHLFRKFQRVNISIRGLANFLEINEKTVSKWILRARNIQPKYNFPIGCNYDMDELHTYVGNKKNLCCIAFGWNRDLHEPIGIHVGGWTTEELNQVGKKILFYHPAKVFTDGLVQYKGIFSNVKHRIGRHVAQKWFRDQFSYIQ